MISFVLGGEPAKVFWSQVSSGSQIACTLGGFRVWVLGCRVQCLEIRVKLAGSAVQPLKLTIHFGKRGTYHITLIYAVAA